MASHGQAWLVMSGQWPVNGQPRTQRSSTWQRLALRSSFSPRKLHFASGSNPNGSVHNIAGILNSKGNVLGMMPHPERAMADWMGSSDGRRLFESALNLFPETADAA